MKKVLILIVFLLFISGCSLVSKTNSISNILEVDVSECDIKKSNDTHGGFLGDGEYYAKLNCSDLKINDNWNDLPISQEINTVLEMPWCDEEKCQTFYEKYNIPTINNGKYLFIDRHSESKNRYDYTELNNRSSYNFSIGIYDIDNRTLYFYSIDT